MDTSSYASGVVAVTDLSYAGGVSGLNLGLVQSVYWIVPTSGQNAALGWITEPPRLFPASRPSRCRIARTSEDFPSIRTPRGAFAKVKPRPCCGCSLRGKWESWQLDPLSLRSVCGGPADQRKSSCPWPPGSTWSMLPDAKSLPKRNFPRESTRWSCRLAKRCCSCRCVGDVRPRRFRWSRFADGSVHQRVKHRLRESHQGAQEGSAPLDEPEFLLQHGQEREPTRSTEKPSTRLRTRSLKEKLDSKPSPTA